MNPYVQIILAVLALIFAGLALGTVSANSANRHRLLRITHVDEDGDPVWSYEIRGCSAKETIEMQKMAEDFIRTVGRPR